MSSGPSFLRPEGFESEPVEWLALNAVDGVGVAGGDEGRDFVQLAYQEGIHVLILALELWAVRNIWFRHTGANVDRYVVDGHFFTSVLYVE